MNTIELLTRVITAIENSTEEIYVCIPSPDYYVNFRDTRIGVINPYRLRRGIENIIRNLELTQEDLK